MDHHICLRLIHEVPFDLLSSFKNNNKVSNLSITFINNNDGRKEKINLVNGSLFYTLSSRKKLLILLSKINKNIKSMHINAIESSSNTSRRYNYTKNILNYDLPAIKKIFNFMSIMACTIEHITICVYFKKAIKYMSSSISFIDFIFYMHEYPMLYFSNFSNKLRNIEITNSEYIKKVTFNKLPYNLKKIMTGKRKSQRIKFVHKKKKLCLKEIIFMSKIKCVYHKPYQKHQ
jgi:hypothetical protein